MTQDIALTGSDASALPVVTENSELLTVMLGDQIFGIPILKVQDVLGQQQVTRVPLAPAEVAGSLNLRGRIVTALRVRTRLGLPPIAAGTQEMSIVVESEGELYSLIFDAVGDVLTLNIQDFEQNPRTLDPKFREVSDGIYRLSDKLLVVLDIEKLLSGISPEQ